MKSYIDIKDYLHLRIVTKLKRIYIKIRENDRWCK